MAEVTREIEETSWKLTFGFMAALLYMWGWILVNVPELHNIALIYLLMTLLAVLIGGLAYVSGSIPLGVLGFPLLRDTVQPTFVGVAAGLLWVVIGGQIARLSSMQVAIYETLPPLIAYMFAFAIASTEETLFRGVVLPSLVRLSGNRIVGVIITSLLFSAMHWLTYQSVFSYLLSAFLFSIIISFLTLHYRTAWVAGVAHITYNLIIVYSLVGRPF